MRKPLISGLVFCAALFPDQVSWGEARIPDLSTPAAISQLLATGGSPNAAGDFQITHLMRAVSENAPLDTLKSLIEAGASVNATDQFGNSALVFAVLYNSNPDLCDLLISHGAPPAPAMTRLEQKASENSTLKLQTHNLIRLVSRMYVVPLDGQPFTTQNIAVVKSMTHTYPHLAQLLKLPIILTEQFCQTPQTLKSLLEHRKSILNFSDCVTRIDSEIFTQMQTIYRQTSAQHNRTAYERYLHYFTQFPDLHFIVNDDYEYIKGRLFSLITPEIRAVRKARSVAQYDRFLAKYTQSCYRSLREEITALREAQFSQDGITAFEQCKATSSQKKWQRFIDRYASHPLCKFAQLYAAHPEPEARFIIQQLQTPPDPEEWRIVIESLKLSVKSGQFNYQLWINLLQRFYATQPDLFNQYWLHYNWIPAIRITITKKINATTYEGFNAGNGVPIRLYTTLHVYNSTGNLDITENKFITGKPESLKGISRPATVLIEEPFKAILSP